MFLNYLMAILGLCSIFVVSYVMSTDRKNIRYFPILRMFILQVILAFILLKTSSGTALVGSLSNGFTELLDDANEGVNFVFQGIANKGSAPFFLTVLMPIVFISALIGILRYIKILPFFMKYVGLGLQKINGMGKLESYNGIASAVLGQSEVFITLKKELTFLSERRMMTFGISTMSTISLSIMGSYMRLIQPEYVITAVVLNLFGGFIISSIVNPYVLDPSEKDELETKEDSEHTFFQVLGEYMLDGFKVAVTVAAMLIGFVALIAFINSLFMHFIGISFQQLLGYVFAPLAFLTGIPWDQSVDAGSLMATKLATNEFVAMTQLTTQEWHFSERSLAIISVFLVSFANFSSIGVLSGAVKGLNEEKSNLIAKHGLKILGSATLVSFLSSIIVGLII